MSGPIDRRREAVLEAVESRGQIGGRFSGLKRIDPLGGGGNFSLVFRGVDEVTGSIAVIKVMDILSNPDPYRISSFHREPDVLSRIQDCGWTVRPLSGLESVPLLLRLGGGVEFPLDFPFYAMEAANGSLEGEVYRGRQSVERRLELFREACRAVQAVHARGLVHRDIKPSNFLLFGRRVKISDFGTSRFLSDTPLLTSYLGFPPGDRRYCAPELFAGVQDDDPSLYLAADMFALGATLFELMTEVPLGLLLYESGFVEDFAKWIGAVKPTDRRAVFDGVIRSVADARPIPGVSAYAIAPRSIVSHLDGVIADYANLDYRRRPTDLSSMFRRLEICLIMLRHDRRTLERMSRRRLLRSRSSEVNTRAN